MDWQEAVTEQLQILGFLDRKLKNHLDLSDIVTGGQNCVAHVIDMREDC